ncbi:hypothetical protein SAMN05216383_10939 [Prevotella sp. KH2C16]|nr:hypothetical protein SAMN05216383_10939 [Prevotella sp. KH2C16]
MFILALMALTARNSVKADGISSIQWEFNTLDGWVYEHQDDAPVSQCSANAGNLYIYTRANTRDRQKMHTKDKIYTFGRYSWRTYISNIAAGEQTSIGSWIYCDEQHEIDFEVGPGTSAIREQYGIQEGELVACMTSQGFPYVSGYTAITPGWHVFTIELKDVRGSYEVHWLIDGEEKQKQSLRYGDEKAFYIYCSVENLSFIGDFIPVHRNYGMFDWVSFTNHEDATSIQNISFPEQTVIYNLQGCKVDNPQKGELYIINNKKMIY